MRLLICAGGTGGGVYPASAVLSTIQRHNADIKVLWVGGEGGMEARLMERVNIPFKSIPAAGIHGVGLRQLPGNIIKLLRGVKMSNKILHEFHPDVLFFTGGYLAVPMALAGMRIPTVLFVPDIEPGLALKTLGRFADRIAVISDDSRRYFSRGERIILTGYPVRHELTTWSHFEACRKLNLSENLPTLLIVGGSKGALSINHAVLAHLPELLEVAQIIHISGELDWMEVDKKAREMGNPHYHVFPYLHEDMGAALAASDLVISRAGASTLGEYPFFGLPSILVPYPYAWRYQKVNAGYMVKHGAAVMLEDKNLEKELPIMVRSILSDRARMESMHDAVKNLARPQAASDIGSLLMELAGRREDR
jgi:undecaprenyldiphospho-muramoylpentapeptide beta-N-acetylglucosaminyltransferase